MKGRCYYKNPCNYFIQYTGDNADEVRKFVYDVTIADVDVKEFNDVDSKSLLITIDYGDMTAEVPIALNEFIVIDEEQNIDPCTESVFYKYFQIANEEGGQQ